MNWKKVFKILLWVIFSIFIFFSSVILILHVLSGDDIVSEIETHRLVSPNGKVDAVVIEADGGATTSVVQRIYVVEHGSKVLGKPQIVLDGALIKKYDQNTSKYGVNIDWDSTNELRISYSSVKRKIINSLTIQVNNQTIYICT